MHILVKPHPLLQVRAFITRLESPLTDVPTPAEILRFFALDTPSPIQVRPDIKPTVRDLLRCDGFKPTGRSKPASEYLIKAIEKGWFTPDKGINLAVDACNVVSLRSGLPISVVDADLLNDPLSIQVTPAKTEYIFNPSGQIIDVGQLFALCDAEGPCAGPVKDSQRTKTHDGTRNTVSIIWGTRDIPGHTDAALKWYLELLHSAGASTENVALTFETTEKGAR